MGVIIAGKILPSASTCPGVASTLATANPFLNFQVENPSSFQFFSYCKSFLLVMRFEILEIAIRPAWPSVSRRLDHGVTEGMEASLSCNAHHTPARYPLPSGINAQLAVSPGTGPLQKETNEALRINFRIRNGPALSGYPNQTAVHTNGTPWAWRAMCAIRLFSLRFLSRSKRRATARLVFYNCVNCCSSYQVCLSVLVCIWLSPVSSHRRGR